MMPLLIPIADGWLKARAASYNLLLLCTKGTADLIGHSPRFDVPACRYLRNAFMPDRRFES
jgi:hypothetical protein